MYGEKRLESLDILRGMELVLLLMMGPENCPEIPELLDSRLIPSLYLVDASGVVLIKGTTEISIISDRLSEIDSL